MPERISQGSNMPRSSFLQSCRVVFDISFGQAMRSKKTVFMLIAAFLPVVLAIVYRILGRDEASNQAFSRIVQMDPQQTLSLVMLFYLQFLSVLVALFYGTALVADEVDNRTIIYLFTRPIRKYSIIVGKFAAYILEVFLILIPPMLLIFLIIGTESSTSSNFADRLSFFGKQLGVTVLALIAYGAIFTMFGIWLKRPVLLGFLLVGWEKIVLIVPGAIRKFSVAHYLLSLLLSGLPKGPGMQQVLDRLPKAFSASGPTLSVVVLFAITIAFLGLSIFMLYRKEYRFE